MVPQAAPAHDVAHVTLRLGRLMLVNGADTAHVQDAVTAFAARLGHRVHLLVGLEGLLLTIEDGEGFHTRLGPAITAITVNMGALAALDGIRNGDIPLSSDLSGIDRSLDRVEHGGNRFPPWLVAVAMGVTAASLARLFGALWAVVGVSCLVGVATQLVRQLLAAATVNPVAAAGLAAFAGGLVGALAMKAFPDIPPTLCLVVAGMILVPGVPLLNGVRDLLGKHVGTGIGRLMLGAVTVLAITVGLFRAAGLAGDTLPVGGTLPLLPSAEDVLFAGLAGGGYALLFNVPARAAWICVICGMAGHGLRTVAEHLGLALGAASLLGAFAAALVARKLAGRLHAPAVTFAFPGVVAMIPGSYAFRAGIGGLSIMASGGAAPSALVGETIGLAVTAVVVTASIAIGLCLALAAPRPGGVAPSTASKGASR